jgi:hypothetical protein
LTDNDLCESRTLKIGECTNCGVQVAELTEKRKSDGKVFCSAYSGKKAAKIIEKERYNISYTLDSISVFKNKTLSFKGICYGDNRIVKIGKYFKKRVYRVGYWGNKELISENNLFV